MSTLSPNPVVRLVVALGDGLALGDVRKTFIGRDAWALNELILAGERGVTPLDRPAPRWSHYIFKLRRGGLTVETIHEGHGGAFSGHHAKYVLRSPLRVVETVRQGERARSAA